jgi:hypothetical protein
LLVWPERGRVLEVGNSRVLRVEHEGFVALSGVGRLRVRPADAGVNADHSVEVVGRY